MRLFIITVLSLLIFSSSCDTELLSERTTDVNDDTTVETNLPEKVKEETINNEENVSKETEETSLPENNEEEVIEEEEIVEDSFPIKSTVAITSSRTYNPSSWMNNFDYLSAAVYRINTENSLINGVTQKRLNINTGNSGNGWLGIYIENELNFCFQGVSPNTSTTSTAFKFVGVKSKEHNCDNNSHPFISFNNFDENGNILINLSAKLTETKATIKIHGGGCGSFCSTTEATITFIAVTTN